MDEQIAQETNPKYKKSIQINRQIGIIPRVHRHDLVIEAREAPLIFSDQLRGEPAGPVVGNIGVDLARLGHVAIITAYRSSVGPTKTTTM